MPSFMCHRHFILTTVLTLAACSARIEAQTYTDLFDFDGTAHGCCQIHPGNLAQGRDGNLYGTTNSGGAHLVGAVFKMTPTGALTLLHSFDSTDGSSPRGGLSLGMDGNFYGTTVQGGASSGGTVFQITPSGAFKTLYSFTNGTDGAFPFTPPVPGPDGNLYGLTGNSTNHVFYRITTAGVFTSLATMPSQSEGALVLGVDGKFYGTTLHGGTFNAGTAFSVTTQGVLKTLFNFNNPTGANPSAGLMQASDGNFYGVASIGGTSSGGVVFKMTPAGANTVLHNFSTGANAAGSLPTSALVQGSDGFLYGTAGGGTTGNGVIFKIRTNGMSFAVIVNLDGTHGSNPDPAPLLHTNGRIYGLTNGGGAHNEGVVYSLDAGLKPFVSVVVLKGAKVGASVGVLGQGFSSATGVLFGTGAGTFTATGDTFITAKLVAGATTGLVTVQEPGGNLLTPQKFKIVPTIASFTPTSGTVGTQVVITGMSLLQATAVKFGAVVASFTANSNTQVTATVPTGAVTGKISVTTPGGTANSATSFTVN